jgi:hypothetical protein
MVRLELRVRLDVGLGSTYCLVRLRVRLDLGLG